MPQSMTGFATADIAVGDVQLSWELRSVNHRFLDLSFRLPDQFRSLESDYRDLVGARFGRGKLDLSLKIIAAGGSSGRLSVDGELLTELASIQSSVKKEHPGAGALTVAELLRWPGVLKEPEPELEALAQPARQSLLEAIDALERARASEGRRIAEQLEQRIEAILALVDSVRSTLSESQARYRRKLVERLDRLDVKAEPERLEQELAMIAQRLDISEEVDRLAGHVAEIRDVLSRPEPIGRRLDFLIQELNREANTLASKSQDDALTRSAVDLKVLIEQMREQVQNLE